MNSKATILSFSTKFSKQESNGSTKKENDIYVQKVVFLDNFERIIENSNPLQSYGQNSNLSPSKPPYVHLGGLTPRKIRYVIKYVKMHKRWWSGHACWPWKAPIKNTKTLMPSSLDNYMLRILYLENVMHLSLCHLSYFVASIKRFCSIDLDIFRREFVFSQWVGIGVCLSMTRPDTAHMFNQAQQYNIRKALCVVWRVVGCCMHANLDWRWHTAWSAHGRPVEMRAQHCIKIECFGLEWSSQGCVG